MSMPKFRIKQTVELSIEVEATDLKEAYDKADAAKPGDWTEERGDFEHDDE